QNPDLGDAREDIPVTYKGQPLQIGFNARYLMDVLQVVETEKMNVELCDELSPGVLKPTDQGAARYTAVIMPMRISCTLSSLLRCCWPLRRRGRPESPRAILAPRAWDAAASSTRRASTSSSAVCTRATPTASRWHRASACCPALRSSPELPRWSRASRWIRPRRRSR